MITKRMAFLYIKACIVIFVLCFTVVQLASIHRGANQPDVQKHDIPDLNVGQIPNKPDHDIPELNVGQIPNKPDHDIPDSNVGQIPNKPDLRKNINADAIKAHVIEQQNAPNEDNNNQINNDKLDKDVPQNNVEIHEMRENPPGEKEIENKPAENIAEKPGVLEKPEEMVKQEHEGVEQVVEQPHKDDVIIEEVKAKELIEPNLNKNNMPRGDEREDDEFPAHNIRKIEKLPIGELQPPDHMDGVRMEQDGHLNKDYKKEIILGNHEEFEKDASYDAEDLLEKIFDKVDKDRDHFISLPELEDWIITKVQEHFEEANGEAERIFKHLDTGNTGFVSWEDFHIHFLVAKGYDEEKAKKQVDDYEAIALDPDEKERLIRYKFRWAEADEEPQDNKLTLKEFKSFRHPEQSPEMLDRMVQDIIDNLDQNNDGVVTEDEFIALPPGEVDGAFIESDRLWQEERRKEFRNVIDLDKDGKISRSELKNYVDPQNPNHARMEADNLVQLADNNKDGRLSLEEVLDNAELFIGSKMVDTGRNFHDEF